MATAEARMAETAALLIDADNLSAAAIEQVFTHLAHQGLRVALRRAYGGHDKLAGMREPAAPRHPRPVNNAGHDGRAAGGRCHDLLHAADCPRVRSLQRRRLPPLALRLPSRPARHLLRQAGKSADGDWALLRPLVSVEGGPTPRRAGAGARRAARPGRRSATHTRARRPPVAPRRRPTPSQVLESVEVSGRAAPWN